MEWLRNLGHDVLTVQEAGNANQRIPDDQVLAFAVSQERSMLTINRIDFIRLHRRDNEHFGIVVCTNNRNWEQFAIHPHSVLINKSQLIEIDYAICRKFCQTKRYLWASLQWR